MSIDVNFYTYGKKINSTATPSAVNYAATCELRAGTDQLNPVILLDYPNPVAFNYAQIPAFSRYYFINEWTWQGGVWAGSLRVDPLASWKNTIRAYPQYVLRSASKYNPRISDMYPLMSKSMYSDSRGRLVTGYTWITFEKYFNGQHDREYNFIVLAAVNKITYTDGGEEAYNNQGLLPIIVNNLGLQQIFAGLRRSDIFTGDFSKSIAKIVWYPFQMSGDPVYKFTLDGNTFVVTSDSECTFQILTKNKAVNVTKWDLSAPLQDLEFTYKNEPPYYDAKILFQPFGHVNFDFSQFNGMTEITVECDTDVISNTSALYLEKSSADSPILISQNSIGIDIPISSVMNRTIEAVTAAASVVANPLNIADALVQGMAAFVPSVTISGSPSSAIISDAPYFTCVKRDNANESPEKLGRPLCEYVDLDTLSGFCQCKNASLPLTCTEIEHNQILQYMNGGFYLE